MSLRFFRAIVVLWCVTCSHFVSAEGVMGSASDADSQPKKFALVIGNANYGGSMRNLKNPVNDAKLMTESLTKLGFQVRQFIDLDRAGLSHAVSAFSESLPQGATALVFYAGHGMQVGGFSYLVPIDMPITSEQSVPLRAFPVRTLLEQMSAAKSVVNVLVFDACRDNPFQPPPPVQYRNFANLGLAPIQAPRGTMVAYSTAPGQLAADGKDSNSVYTAALAKVIRVPGLSLEDIFKKVGYEVRKKTSDDQIPWFESSLTEEYFLLPPAGITVVAGRPLKRESSMSSPQIEARSLLPGGTGGSDVLWYRLLADTEWSALEQTLQERVKSVNGENLPQLRHQATGGSVIAQTILARVLRDGLQVPAGAEAGHSGIADKEASLAWFQKASDAGFPIAELDLSEMLLDGHGAASDRVKALDLVESASKANYPRAQLQWLKLGIANKLVNRDDVRERLADLENKVRSAKNSDLTRIPDDVLQKELKQRDIGLLRKELAIRGLPWSNTGFGDALMNGDIESVTMYLDAGWNPLSQYGEGNALAHFIWRAGNLPPTLIEAMLKLFVEHGVNPNAAVLKFRGLAPRSMAISALQSCNSVALAASIKLGAITSDLTNSIKQGGYVQPTNDGGLDCKSQIAKIGSLLNMHYRCGPQSWDRTQTACELF